MYVKKKIIKHAVFVYFIVNKIIIFLILSIIPKIIKPNFIIFLKMDIYITNNIFRTL